MSELEIIKNKLKIAGIYNKKELEKYTAAIAIYKKLKLTKKEKDSLPAMTKKQARELFKEVRGRCCQS